MFSTLISRQFYNMVGCEITYGKKMTAHGSCLKQKASTETNDTSILDIPKLVNYVWLSDFRDSNGSSSIAVSDFTQ